MSISSLLTQPYSLVALITENFVKITFALVFILAVDFVKGCRLLSLLLPQPSGLSKESITSLAQKRYRTDTSTMHPMEGKVAVITGAAGGIGGEISKILHSLGATIVALDCNKNGLEELQNYLNSQSIEGIDNVRDFGDGSGRVWTIAIGQEDLSAVAATTDEIKKRYGKIDILLNNAGIGYKQASDVGKAKNGMDLAFTVNYLSHFLLTEKLLETLSNASPKGRVVHLTSSFHWKVNGSALCPLPDGSILASESDPSRQGPKHFERAYANSKLAQVWYSRCMRKKSGTTVRRS
jgi:NAD(P)-dependent dehydrogenase (short-subunit alcohol dehydrogenase family)